MAVEYDVTYVVFALIAIGLARFICCQPDAVSPVNVTDARSVPVRVHKWPTWVPVLFANL